MVDGVVTVANVVSGTGAPAASFRILVESELMLVTSLGTGLNWTVVRGIEGTTAVAHTSGVAVAHVLSKGGLDAYGFENMTAFFPGVDTGGVRTVGLERQWNVFEEFILRGELVVDGGNLNVMSMP